MTAVFEVGHGSLRVVYEPVGGIGDGKRAASWLRDFVCGVTGAVEFTEAVASLSGACGSGASQVVPRRAVECAGWLLEGSADGKGGGSCGETIVVEGIGARVEASDRDAGETGVPVVGVDERGEGVSAKSEQYQRNCARRLKNKQRKLRRAEDRGSGGSPVPQWRRGAGPVTASVPQGYFAGLPDDVQRKLKESRAQLLIEKNKRELLEEQSKLRYLESPMAAVNEAMRALGVVERIAKKENAGKILEWASKASESYASSVSGVASEVPSGSGVSANSSVSVAEKRVVREWGLRKVPASAPERILLVNGVLSSDDLVVARGKVGRKLNSLDMLRKDAPFGLTAALRYEIERSEERVCPNDIYL